jgi:uncharacterized membrane protein YqhA
LGTPDKQELQSSQDQVFDTGFSNQGKGLYGFIAGIFGGGRVLKRILEGSRYLVLVGVISSLAASLATFLWGLWKTVVVITSLATTGGQEPLAVVRMIELMDKFLIAVGLYIFAVGLYELFIGELDLPDWLEIHDLHTIKSRLSQILMLVMAVTFLEHLVEWKDSVATLHFAIGITLVMSALIAFNHFVEKK